MTGVDPLTVVGPARYAEMQWNAPLDDAHAELLLDRLDVTPGGAVLDLGCGWGELLMRAVARAEGARGTGVDTDAALLARGRALARDRGLADRVRFVCGSAEGWSTAGERIICVGASHAWGGTAAALAALADLAEPGGRLLYGDGCWEAPPTRSAAEMFDRVPPLPGLLDAAAASGWRVLHLSTASVREWDAFETDWRRGSERWLAAHPADPAATALRRLLDERMREYVTAYRGVLGFAYLVLGR